MGMRLCDFEKDFLHGCLLFRLHLESLLVSKVDMEDCHYEIWLEHDYLYLTDLDLNVFTGVKTNYDEDGEVLSEQTVYWFYDKETYQRVYMTEAPDLRTAIKNFCIRRGHKELIDNIWQMDCTFVSDRTGRFIKEANKPIVSHGMWWLS